MATSRAVLEQLVVCDQVVGGWGQARWPLAVRIRTPPEFRWPEMAFGGQDRIRVLGVFDFLGHFQDQWDFQNGCGSFDLADLAVDSGQSQLFGEFDGAMAFQS